MSLRTKREDKQVRDIRAILRRDYGAQHPGAKIDVYRYNSASIRIRIIDSAFAGKTIPEREEMVWPILEGLPERTQSEITVLLVVTPGESKHSMMSMEFDDPTPSEL
jgi:stress-induced morphogen